MHLEIIFSSLESCVLDDQVSKAYHLLKGSFNQLITPINSILLTFTNKQVATTTPNKMNEVVTDATHNAIPNKAPFVCT